MSNEPLYPPGVFDMSQLSDDELRVLEKKYRAQAKELLSKANRAFSIRVARDSATMLATAEAARQRALQGTCTCDQGGPCDVHQMGGKPGLEKRLRE